MKNILQKIKNKKSSFLVVFFTLILFVFLPVGNAHAGIAEALKDTLTDDSILFSAISWLLQTFVLSIVAYFVRFAAWTVDMFLNPTLYTTVLSSSVIDTGWRTVRDFCNMFYIFFLLLIAFSTITRNQTYSAKSLLPRFILSLFLINFSAVIAKVFIDFGQVFLFGIAAWMGSFSSDTGAASSLTSVVTYFQNQFAAQKATSMSTVFLVIFAIVYSLMLGFLYIMLAGFLLVRLIMFVILIMVSPFAFFSIVLPSMRKNSSEWWDALFKNVISGPVFIFFVYVSSNLAYELAGSTVLTLPNELGFAQSTLTVTIPMLIAIGMLWAAIPASQRIGAAGSKQLIGGTLGLGKVAMGTYAATKVVSKPTGWVASRGHGIAMGNERYSKAVDWTNNKMAKIPLGVGGAILKNQANKAQEMKVRVDAHKSIMKTFTPQQMADYVGKTALDPKAKNERRLAMMETLMEKGKMSDEDLMKAGYRTKGVSGEDVFDVNKFKEDMKFVKNYGGDVDDIYKQRVDLVLDKGDIEKEINKSFDKNELGKQKLDILSDPDVRESLRKNIPKEQLEKWIENKSQGEKDAYLEKREREMAVKIDSGALHVTDQEFKDFQQESALLASVNDKQRRMSEIDAATPVVANRLNYKKDTGTPAGAPPTYTQNIDINLADSTLEKMSKSNLLNLDKDFLEKNGHMLSKANIKYIGERGSKDQIIAIKTAIDDALSAHPTVKIPSSLMSAGALDRTKLGDRQTAAERAS